jgi:hypothetical protein
VQNGIAGSAKLEGTIHVPGRSVMANAHPSVKRAVILWGIAFGILVVFHVGGANIGGR